jgi:hypothetical protein
MGNGLQACENIQQGRDADRPHLLLCNQLYLRQVSNSSHCHLEQPRGSEMIMQAELNDVCLGTLPATFDMYHAGRLRLPGTDQFLQKRTQVFTTSRTVLRHSMDKHALEIMVMFPSKVNLLGKWRSISFYAQTYTTHFCAQGGGSFEVGVSTPASPIDSERVGPRAR